MPIFGGVAGSTGPTYETLLTLASFSPWYKENISHSFCPGGVSAAGSTGSSGVRGDQGQKGHSYWGKEMLSLGRRGRMVRSRDKESGCLVCVWG